MNKQWKKHCKISGGRTTRRWTRHINRITRMSVWIWHCILTSSVDDSPKEKDKEQHAKRKNNKSSANGDETSKCRGSMPPILPRPWPRTTWDSIRDSIWKNDTNFSFFQQISATKNRTTPENSCYLLLTCWPEMLCCYPTASKLFCLPAVKRVAAHSKPHANASAQTLSPIPPDSTWFNLCYNKIHPNLSGFVYPSRRRSSNQATQSSSHGHAPNRTWSYLANLHWKTIFGIMKHLHSLHTYPMYPDSIIFYHLYHVTYLVSSFPLAALARLRQTSSDL